jgi:preprotein translocase subunit Sss1
MQNLFEEHRRETDERFQRLIDHTEESRAKQIRADARLDSIGSSLEMVAENLKELAKVVHKEPSKAPYFQIIGAVGLVIGMAGTLIVGYVQREVAHNASEAEITLEWSRATADGLEGTLSHMDERVHWIGERIVALEKRSAASEVSRRAIGDYAKEHVAQHHTHIN